VDIASTMTKYRIVNATETTVISRPLASLSPAPNVRWDRIATRIAEPFCANITAR
jgi:hypothetical protein